ncbi:MAG: 1-deoxy-D-xylulose-5-phosphate reductoisomerase [Chloroflexi bacterium]|jgi:1-deoxy-D-xylulose-5-phosphate reductoisomerase|nr:MAG: 1-deoxy-D-xylulose-5-phosphate reductoisomerase [Chloroflexota bacterium]
MADDLMKRVAILGSTGSVGRQTLDVVRSFPEHLSVVGLAGWSNSELLEAQIGEFNPKITWSRGLSEETQNVSDGLEEMATHPDVDVVVVATTGFSSLSPTLAALRLGKTVALASKEAVVMAGSIIQREIQSGGKLFPVDSEPSAIWQCLQGESSEVSGLTLTASGGAFRDRSLDQLDDVTPEEALAHPTWQMGAKITVDSATLMNKAFEIIEARWLFGVDWDRIQAVIHPQSIVHSFVEFHDGSVKAQLAFPDMRLPIQYALMYPERISGGFAERMEIEKLGSLEFYPLDDTKYPCYREGLKAARLGGTYPAALCGADDVAVELFLGGKISFLAISELVKRVLVEHKSGDETSLEDIVSVGNWARIRAHELAGI